MCMQYLQQPEEGTRSAGTAVIQTGVSGYWESNTTHVEQQRVPLTLETPRSFDLDISVAYVGYSLVN